jgi:hypothetical protein
LRPFLTFNSHAIQMRCADRWIAKAAQVSPAQVIAKNNHDIWRSLGSQTDRVRSYQRQKQQCKSVHQVFLLLFTEMELRSVVAHAPEL